MIWYKILTHRSPQLAVATAIAKCERKTQKNLKNSIKIVKNLKITKKSFERTNPQVVYTNKSKIIGQIIKIEHAYTCEHFEHKTRVTFEK